MEQIRIHEEYIKLGQFLKLAGIADTGGQAKYYIMDGKIKVNGEIVTQRGKKIFPGDIVDIYEIASFQIIK